GWKEGSIETIHNCWHYAQILLPNVGYSDNLHEANNLELRDLISSLDMLCLSNAMKVDKFLNINGEELYEENIEVVDDEMDDSIEPEIISSNSALNGLESVQDVFALARRF
ncbi:8449_t:CDS:2, partial [Gigaspora rosea]